MTREAAENNWCDKFINFGLDEKFEFIGRDWTSDRGRKSFVKCKTCETQFTTWGIDEVFKGRQSHLLCPECGTGSDGNDIWERSPKCDAAMDYYQQGHTIAETAKKFGVTESAINNPVKVRGLTNGRRGKLSPERVEQQRQEAIKKISDRLDGFGLEYIEGYINNESNVKIRCKKCGLEFERTASFTKSGNVVCRRCEHEKALIRQEERRQKQIAESAIRHEQREAERLKKNPLGLSYYELEKQRKMDEVHVCKVCGMEYTPRQYMESEGLILFSNVGYCSHECKRKAMNRLSKANKRKNGVRDNHRPRAKKYGCEYDPSITLKKLIKRDGLQCAICGNMCDLNDRSWTKYSGPMYPSIDHIIPMAKGGNHTWDNVQIAHIICNSNKGDNLEEVM